MINLDNLNTQTPFMLSKFQNQDNISYFSGKIHQCDKISQIQGLRSKKDVLLLPFESVSEKYEFIKKYGSKILIMNVEEDKTISLNEAMKSEAILNTSKLKTIDYIQSDEEYMQAVSDVVSKEINNGEGSNFMICLKAEGQIESFSTKKAVGLFLRLVKNEYGAYHVFCFFTGNDFIIGASPECHLNVSKNKVDCNRISGTINKDAITSKVRMQPISGTFRKNDSEIQSVKLEMLKFLTDKKEINELFMTIDEELKMMAKICPFGGKIIGPRLREMSKVIHTEYLLSGNTQMNIYDVIKESMHAATLVGSPIENAFRVIQKYNDFDKEYYSSLIGIIDEDDNFDSSIIIRTIRSDISGKFSVFAGASIVKDSIPANELKESKAKMSSILYNLQNHSENQIPKILDYLLFDHDIVEALEERNKNLSHFWFFDKTNNYLQDRNLLGKNILIIDNEDSFTQMLRHILNKIGFNTSVISYKDCNINNLAKYDTIVVGPGPGDPNEIKNQKIAKVDKIVGHLFQQNIKTLGVCLGHQIISRKIGYKVSVGKSIMQGEPQIINLFGSDAIVGFYNTFFAINDNIQRNQVHHISQDPITQQIYALRGENFSSFQFHPESLLTQNGFEIIQKEMQYLFGLCQ